jgi:GNAT superfamily N-acetyltransferase
VKVVVSRLIDLPVDKITPLVIESEQEGWRFLRRLLNEWIGGSNRFDQPGEALFAACAGDEIISLCGLNVDPYAADSTIGRVRRLYVAQAFRGDGVGRGLVQMVVQFARSHFQVLRVRTENPEAGRLYEGLGFVPTIGMPECTHLLDLNKSIEKSLTD